MEVFQQSYFALFAIICIGYIIGNIKFKGISLDISAIIFVALIFGHYGIVMPPIIEKIGLILFIYTIGIQAGPGFFDSFKKQGRTLAAMATIIIISAALISYLAIVFMDIDVPVAIGLLTGALTSTPGLAAAIDSTGSSGVSIGYGIAYPFGVIGVILFVRLYPKFTKTDLKKAEEDYEKQTEETFPEIFSKHFVVENENAAGKTIRELRVRTMSQGVISRVKIKGEPQVPTSDTVLNLGDIVRAVGTREALKKVELLIGHETQEEIPLKQGYEVQTILVSNPNVVNKTVHEIYQWTATYHVTITRVRRSGIDITPTPNFKLHLGDKIIITCSKSHVELVTKLFGGNSKKLSDTNFLPIAAGIVLGFVIGEFSLNFGHSFTFSLGLTGGVLAVAMILSRIGKTGPIIWSMSGGANQLLRTMGLMFFLAGVGTSAGAHIVETFSQYGFKLFLVGGVVTLIPMLLGALVARWFFKVNVLSLLGALTGSMTSTPGLAAVDPMTETNAASIAYATVYPVAMVLLIICVQVLASLG
ncbi:putative transport protein [Saccharicrinis carchari]|uniref:Putative transport protein n=1 Tax=Saccharicrinis carchari TaxID=1168039 RepID=A0A521CQE9_SACCC|nr:aspartate:alanine exchanger family transporter [Saccharicrinis carchari]SMO61638.1 putative transport protein [Saccharicrinis carchari]